MSKICLPLGKCIKKRGSKEASLIFSTLNNESEFCTANNRLIDGYKLFHPCKFLSICKTSLLHKCICTEIVCSACVPKAVKPGTDPKYASQSNDDFKFIATQT